MLEASNLDSLRTRMFKGTKLFRVSIAAVGDVLITLVIQRQSRRCSLLSTTLKAFFSIVNHHTARVICYCWLKYQPVLSLRLFCTTMLQVLVPQDFGIKDYSNIFNVLVSLQLLLTVNWKCYCL